MNSIYSFWQRRYFYTRINQQRKRYWNHDLLHGL